MKIELTDIRYFCVRCHAMYTHRTKQCEKCKSESVLKIGEADSRFEEGAYQIKMLLESNKGDLK